MPIFNDVAAGRTLPASFSWSATYIAILVLMQIVLMTLVILQRRAKRVAFGDGGDRGLTQAVRAHGNFIENVPSLLVMLAMLPLMGAGPILINLVGGLMVAARLCHVQGLHAEKIPSLGRILGVVLTQASLVTAALGLLARAWL